ncbi:hypothetical protein A1O3_02869 [Capronia epimyces CBS 606.96]|uniref:Uncharacterized protein n=1 Tax=Capronia epimyces CBS 606.96 TaxID=1182542 RepID=W9YAC7_9EURO|nr:uncharacterized protein A1O3_02869 [Capronia epimyces CBS 606.96]EXJ89802.1 hypothetical protein A1O3_02869 [Capronia epimyces CBS 606.96]
MSSIAFSLASHIDLNDLDALAATCRSVHMSLTQYAPQLKAHSLRCILDGMPTLTEILATAKTADLYTDASFHYDQVTGASAAWQPNIPVEDAVRPWVRSTLPGFWSSMGVTSKISSCARDLVAPCRSCGSVVCRNCAAKPPSNARLKDRYRRLCSTCLDAPIEAHLYAPAVPHNWTDGVLVSSASSVKSDHSVSSQSTSSSGSGLEDREVGQQDLHSFTSTAFLRGPCTCDTRGVFLCAPCGQHLGVSDTTYKRVWTWRSRYSTHIGGGLGTGLGAGNQGQKCGRGHDCLATGGNAECWVEIDCYGRKPLDYHREHDGGEPSSIGTPDHSSNKPGYFQQEIEGIGGVVKKKMKKRVKVGATVWEYEDEKASGKYLEREAKGAVRSWCGWCGRVCLGPKDAEEACLKLDAIVM